MFAVPMWYLKMHLTTALLEHLVLLWKLTARPLSGLGHKMAYTLFATHSTKFFLLLRPYTFV